MKNLSRMFTIALLLLMSGIASVAFAQGRLEREGIVVYWAVMPPAVVAGAQESERMHSHDWRDGAPQHLMLAVFDKQGNRIQDAKVSAQVRQSGVPAGEVKPLKPMQVDGQFAYGEVFPVVRAGPYRFRILVKLTDRAKELEFSASARLLHHVDR